MTITKRPAPAGTGTFAELDGDNQFDGIVTADNMLYKEAQLGKENIQNYAWNSGDISSALWLGTNVTKLPREFSKDSASDGSILEVIGDELVGKDFVFLVKCTALTEEAQEINLQVNDFGKIGDADYRLQLNKETMIRVSPTTRLPLSAIGIKINAQLASGSSSPYPWELEVSEMIVREKMPTAVMSFGDSIAKTAKLGGVDYDADCYTFKYADQYQIELEQFGIGSARLSWVLQSIKDNTDPSQQIPLLFVHAGLNDIFLDSPEGDPTFVPGMIADLNAIVKESKTVSAGIVLFSIPPVIGSGGNWEAWMEAYRDEFNTYLLTLDDDVVTTIDLDSVLVDGDFDTDGYHPTPDGHLKYVTALETAIGFPRHIDTYGYVEVWDKDIATYADLANKLTTENEVRTVTESTTVLSSDGTILLDCSSVVVTATISGVHNRGQIRRLKCIDATAGSAIVDGNGKLIDGSPTVSLALNESITIQWGGEEFRILQ